MDLVYKNEKPLLIIAAVFSAIFWVALIVGTLATKFLGRHFVVLGSLLPVVGPALRRAEEYTCDRYGVACCQSEADIKAAIAAIAAGDTRWKTINVDAYINQIATTNGFWMSFNELTGDYPWLTKRMATAIAVAQGRRISHPRLSGVSGSGPLHLGLFSGSNCTATGYRLCL